MKKTNKKTETKRITFSQYLWEYYKKSDFDMEIAIKIKKEVMKIKDVKTRKKLNLITPVLFPHEWASKLSDMNIEL